MIEQLWSRSGRLPLPSDPASVEVMIEQLRPRSFTLPLPTDPASVAAVIGQLQRTSYRIQIILTERTDVIAVTEYRLHALGVGEIIQIRQGDRLGRFVERTTDCQVNVIR